MHYFQRPFTNDYLMPRQLQNHAQPAHSFNYVGDMPMTDLMKSNKINTKAYAVMPCASHKRVIPTFTQAYLANEAHWVEGHMRCRELAPHADRCPDKVLPLNEHYSAYGNIRARDHNKQLGKVLRDVARNGLVFKSNVSHIPKYPVVAYQCCADKTVIPPKDFSRVLQRSSQICRVDCRPRPVIDLPRSEEFTGRILY